MELKKGFEVGDLFFRTTTESVDIVKVTSVEESKIGFITLKSYSMETIKENYRKYEESKL